MGCNNTLRPQIAIAPTVMALEFLMHGKKATLRVTLSVVVVCAGVTVATVTDSVAVKNMGGLAVGLSSVVVTALYQIWAGSKQKELQANSSQLLLAYTPQAMGLLVIMVPMLDKIGFGDPAPDTVLGYSYTTAAVAAILLSAVLGILVSLSTFLVIGALSSLTYNIVGEACGTLHVQRGREGGGEAFWQSMLPTMCVLCVWGGGRGGAACRSLRLLAAALSRQAPPKRRWPTWRGVPPTACMHACAGHLKTVIILTGGCLIYGDAMPLKKFLGICVTMVGISWYTYLTVQVRQQQQRCVCEAPGERVGGARIPPKG